MRVAITNILGQQVQQLTTATGTDTEVKLNVPAGVYFVVAVPAGNKWSTRIVVEK